MHGTPAPRSARHGSPRDPRHPGARDGAGARRSAPAGGRRRRQSARRGVARARRRCEPARQVPHRHAGRGLRARGRRHGEPAARRRGVGRDHQRLGRDAALPGGAPRAGGSGRAAPRRRRRPQRAGKVRTASADARRCARRRGDRRPPARRRRRARGRWRGGGDRPGSSRRRPARSGRRSAVAAGARLDARSSGGSGPAPRGTRGRPLGARRLAGRGNTPATRVYAGRASAAADRLGPGGRRPVEEMDHALDGCVASLRGGRSDAAPGPCAVEGTEVLFGDLTGDGAAEAVVALHRGGGRSPRRAGPGLRSARRRPVRLGQLPTSGPPAEALDELRIDAGELVVGFVEGNVATPATAGASRAASSDSWPRRRGSARRAAQPIHALGDERAPRGRRSRGGVEIYRRPWPAIATALAGVALAGVAPGERPAGRGRRGRRGHSERCRGSVGMAAVLEPPRALRVLTGSR